ncbi:Tetrahydrofolate dehydrogenase/cyclohydrolase, NAD(P)-binding domain [seawater metagenome]|uniref:methenyltetrahydrofolate cyclohydrolase n=1 Tax=seawater metagenome TaxID=1561972 RepID=A0A5E8CG54_9ZZZZ
MTIIDGKKIARHITEKLKLAVCNFKELNIIPTLVIIQVGDRSDSNLYIKLKKKHSEEIGTKTVVQKYKETISETELINEIKKLNKDKTINAILIQLPLPKNLNEQIIIDNIDPFKDVDGLTSTALGNLFQGNLNNYCIPCTPLGIINLLETYKIDIEGKNAVVIGRSNIVGKPIATLLQTKNATVTICHSKTTNLKEHTLNADIIITAIGKAKFLKKEFIKQGCTIIDVGINTIKDKKSKSGHKVVGDVDFEDVKDKVGFITPVPGGVGPMTIANLSKNTLNLTLKQICKN